MVNEVVRELDIKPDGIYVDCTLGLAGHSIAISNATNPQPTIIGLEVDEEAIGKAKINIENSKANIKIFNESFLNMESIIKFNAIQSGVDGVLIDLGISSLQLNSTEKGFSFRKNSPLDMRFDSNDELTADYIVNNYSFKKLHNILEMFGEEKSAKNIAKNIIDSRPIKTTLQLSQVIIRVKGKNKNRLLHPATKTFQALRIAVNKELESLESGLIDAIKILGSGRRIVVISYHSLEDRIVKGVFREAASDCVCPPRIPVCICDHVREVRLVTKKSVSPSPLEVSGNPRSRSARMRVAEHV